MKRIEVVMTDKAYKLLRSTLMAKALAGSAYGAADAFLTKLVGAVDGDESLVTYRTADEPTPGRLDTRSPEERFGEHAHEGEDTHE